jgi:hypothetical protein
MRHRQRWEEARARSCRPGVPRNHDPVEKAQRVEHLDRRKRRLVAALRLVERGSGGAAIHDELEEAPTLYTIEVVDFARVSEKCRRVAERQIPL